MITILDHFLNSLAYPKSSFPTETQGLKHFPLAEFAANNVISVSIGFTLFYLNVGSHPTMLTTLLVGGKHKAQSEAVEVTLE